MSIVRAPMPARWCAAAALLVLTPSVAIAGNPWEELMGPGKPRLWTDPKARFYLDLPLGWNAQVRPGAESFVDFWKQDADSGYVARFTVEVRNLPPGVRVAHFDAKIESEVKKIAPGYQLLARDAPRLSGATGRRRHFVYRERNNAELQNEVVQATVVVQERAFVLTFETALGVRAHFLEDFEKMQNSFVGRAPGEEASPMPRQPKRIRAGEMVNPDAIKY